MVACKTGEVSVCNRLAASHFRWEVVEWVKLHFPHCKWKNKSSARVASHKRGAANSHIYKGDRRFWLVKLQRGCCMQT